MDANRARSIMIKGLDRLIGLRWPLAPSEEERAVMIAARAIVVRDDELSTRIANEVGPYNQGVPVATTREECLKSVDPSLHAAADALNAAGVPWELIGMIVNQLVQALIEYLKNRPKTLKAQGHACPVELEQHLRNIVALTCEAHCEAVCAYHDHCCD